MAWARSSDGIRLHYEVLGRAGAPAVLMIQGLGADKHGWDMQRFVLAGRYRVVAFDNRGAGRSDKPFGLYSLEQMADDAVAVLDHVGVDTAHVIGASMGGAIAQIVALKHQHRVRSLTLACTACRNHPWRRELIAGWATQATERGMGSMTREAARWVIGPRSFRRLVPAFGWLGPLAMGRSSHAFAAQVRAILATDESMADQLAAITVPALVMVGNQDILTPRGDSEEIAERLPNAELVVISGAAHGFMVEHATTFNRVLLEFLARVTAEQAARGVASARLDGVKVAVVGAGLAGLIAARTLAAADHEVIVFDRGRSPGGRLATRRIDGAHIDHGAQFFTVRSDEFAAFVQQWQAAEVVREWCRGFAEEGDGYPRYVARGGMNSLAKHLAAGLDVRCNSLVFSLHRNDAGRPWSVKLDDGTSTAHDALVVTCPLPQTFSLLMTAQVTMPEVLWRTDYDRTLALLVVLDGPSAVPPPGGVQGVTPFTFVGDNQAKGISDVPALTLHADPAWSAAHWDDDPVTTHDAMLTLARPFVGDAMVVASQVKRWRFATPQAIWPEGHWSPDAHPSLTVAGDAFAGPHVEGASLSGLSAATALMS